MAEPYDNMEIDGLQKGTKDASIEGIPWDCLVLIVEWLSEIQPSAILRLTRVSTRMRSAAYCIWAWEKEYDCCIGVENFCETIFDEIWLLASYDVLSQVRSIRICWSDERAPWEAPNAFNPPNTNSPWAESFCSNLIADLSELGLPQNELELVRESAVSRPNRPHELATALLCLLIKCAPGLRQFTWDCPVPLPEMLMLAVRSSGCRLKLLDVTQSMGEWTNEELLKVASYPALDTLSCRCEFAEDTDDSSIMCSNGFKETALRMMGGLTPSLRHVELRSMARLKAKLISLELHDVYARGMFLLAELQPFIDFSALQRLTLNLSGKEYSWLGKDAKFPCLKTLEIEFDVETMYLNSETARKNVVSFLQRLAPLEELRLLRYLWPEIGFSAVERHGRTLRYLGLKPLHIRSDVCGRNPRKVRHNSNIRRNNSMTLQDTFKVLDACPLLEEVDLTVERSRQNYSGIFKTVCEKLSSMNRLTAVTLSFDGMFVPIMKPPNARWKGKDQEEYPREDDCPQGLLYSHIKESLQRSSLTKKDVAFMWSTITRNPYHRLKALEVSTGTASYELGGDRGGDLHAIQRGMIGTYIARPGCSHSPTIYRAFSEDRPPSCKVLQAIAKFQARWPNITRWENHVEEWTEYHDKGCKKLLEDSSDYTEEDSSYYTGEDSSVHSSSPSVE
ncbi:hypothetical protein B0I35DRAFT_480285 [Stachybotrys elegans]|uniref:F-box domain-containing protein n=1 Tax=Stachybotrys elegans TaxID=80388 RepID=A0A8K0WPR6_9HYPO|nr:hypothetical protein B0I35DRAFT_480285 [Stachybotrys elegans]